MAIPRLDGTIRSDHDGLNSGLRFGEAHGGEPDGFDPILLKGIQRLVYTLVIFIIIAVGFAWGKAVKIVRTPPTRAARCQIRADKWPTF